MNNEAFKQHLGGVIAKVRKDLDFMEQLTNALVELPEGCHYTICESFVFPALAQLIMRVQVPSRAAAVEVFKRFPPTPAMFSPHVTPPFFRPAAALTIMELNFYAKVFPAIFTSFLNLNNLPDEQQASSLVWYFHPFEDANLRVIISANIENDAARVYENSVSGLPTGNTQIDETIEAGFRSASVWWNHGMNIADWYEMFVGSDEEEDEWSDFIEVKE